MTSIKTYLKHIRQVLLSSQSVDQVKLIFCSEIFSELFLFVQRVIQWFFKLNSLRFLDATSNVFNGVFFISLFLL